MPIVPFNQRRQPAALVPPSGPFALMAAAQMHAEGRLIPVANLTGFRHSDNIDDRRQQAQPSAEEAAAIERKADSGQADIPDSTALSTAAGSSALDQSLSEAH